MLKLHHYLLATASLALVGFAGTQPADATTCNGKTNCSLGTKAYTFGANDIFGGGSTLIGPYWRQMADCYNGYADLVIQTSNLSSPSSVDEVLFNYTGKVGKQNCATTQVATGSTTWYINAGSGNGIGSFFSHDPVVQFGTVNTHAPNTTFPEEFYSNSDAGLSGPQTLAGTDTYIYQNGGTEHNLHIGSPAATTSCGANGAGTGTYGNPQSCYGPLIQIPVSVDDVALAFNPVYEKIVAPGEKEIDYKFRTATIKFSKATMCGIFEGTITDWADSHITADNGNKSLKSGSDPTPTASWHVPLVPVGRTDGSGTTSIVTRHLAAVCGDAIYTVGTTNLPASIAGSAQPSGSAEYPGVDQLGKVTTATGSTGVAYYTAFTVPPNGFGNKCTSGTVLPAGYAGGDCIQQGRVGYDGADYTSPYVKVSKAVSVTLDAVELQNAHGTYEKVGPVSTLAAFVGVNPPSGAAEADPSNWVESLSATVPLANPTQTTAYPLVGTTQTFLYQCYANAGSEATLVGQLGYIYTAKINTDSKLGILAKVGLAPLPSAWLTAINNAFIVGDSQHLNIQPVNSGGGGNCDNTINTQLVGG